MKKTSITIITLFILIVASFAANDRLYEMDGTMVGPSNKTKGPKALAKKNHGIEKNNSILEQFYDNLDTIHISLKNSIHWLEIEKSTNYTICIDDAKEGLWEGNDFSYKKELNCIHLNSGKYVKNGKIWYTTQLGNVHTFNILVGMKYIDLSKQDHLLGYSMVNISTNQYGQIHDRDPARFEKINKILAVDIYKVTECEFIQVLWDSIPSQTNDKYPENYNFWIKKKKEMNKKDLCDIHDSAAIRVFLYNAFIYANNRSIRDGLQPVYTLKIDNNPDNFSTNKKNSDFYIKGYAFFKSNADWDMIFVKINKKANGYRLPYYDEWMALARGGDKKNYANIWGGIKDSNLAAQYAWFGNRNFDDPIFARSDEWKKESCGEWKQNSQPVGMLKPNAFGLYDMMGLVCENVILENKNLYGYERFTTCKGGFLTDSLENMDLSAHCDARNGAVKTFQGLRLVRQLK